MTAWLEYQQLPAELRPGQPDSAVRAVQAWNIMGGTIDWAGLPIVCELLGVADPARLIHQLTVIRAHQHQQE